ncbi:hypothetical protein EJ03DRAFT_245371, partial [Teratosphaeria nubilosa]
SHLKSPQRRPDHQRTTTAPSNRPADRITCTLDPSSTTTPPCIFDPTLNGWIPPACHNTPLATSALRNDTLLARLQAAGPFQWYTDLDHSIPISTADLPAYLTSPEGNMTAHTIEKWHVAHCLYVWRLGNEALRRAAEGERGVYVNARVLSEEHVGHCNEVVASQGYRVGAKAVVQFGVNECVRI